MRESPVRIKFISCALVLWCTGVLVPIGYADQNYPQRIISLGPSITEELYLLGLADKIVGVTTYCQRPPQAQQKEKISTAIEVNLEKVIMLKPDLVLATSLTDPKAVEKLKGLGIRVVSFSSPKNFTEICKQFLELGRIVGKEEKAEKIVSIAKNKVDSVKRKVKDSGKPEVFIQIGAKPLFTVTEDSFVNDFIEFAGGINIAKNAKTGLYSREGVLRKNPNVIIIVTMGVTGEEEKRIWQKFKTLNAVKNNRIYIIDSNKICSPTPLTFVETLEEIAELLHPHLETE